MPSATDELRAKMDEYFGDPIADGPPHEYLITQGYLCDRGWVWRNPKVTLETMPEKEFHCILFLQQEWDYGGFYPYPEANCPTTHTASPTNSKICVHCGTHVDSMR